VRNLPWVAVAAGVAALACLPQQRAAVADPPRRIAQADRGAAPAHVPDMAYYQGLHQNERVNPAWFARHFTMTQQGTDDSYAVRFLHAGGSYAMQYTDPAFVPYCSWPEPYACKGPIGDELPQESEWLHAADGKRLRVVAGANGQNGWQEVLNPASPAVRAAFAAYTRRFRGNAIFADDVSGDVDPTPAGRRDFNQYKFGAQPAEYCDERDCSRGAQQFLRDTMGLLASSAHPVFVNSGPAETALAMMRNSPQIAGAMLEGCYRRADDERTWQINQRFIEHVAALGRYALCLTYPTDNIAADRAFALASFWVVQDGTHAVIWEQVPRTSGDVGLMPEFGVVPAEPLDGGRTFEERRSGLGVYEREYARCAQEGRWFGPCAAVVNVSSLPMFLPKLDGHYTQVMDFSDGGSWYDGATAHWRDDSPRFIGPHSGLILR
jgi:hypothetical protein